MKITVSDATRQLLAATTRTGKLSDEGGPETAIRQALAAGHA
jgi:hypothetical protein